MEFKGDLVLNQIKHAFRINRNIMEFKERILQRTSGDH